MVLPAAVNAALATTGALAVIGPDVDAKVVAALIVSVCPPAVLPSTAFPATVKALLASMAALTVIGPEEEAKVVTALTVSVWDAESPRMTLPWAVKAAATEAAAWKVATAGTESASVAELPSVTLEVARRGD